MDRSQESYLDSVQALQDNIDVLGQYITEQGADINAVKRVNERLKEMNEEVSLLKSLIDFTRI